MMTRLAQTLHGYDQGHRLLAATEALLDTRELALLDRLSDLSGYLPSGMSFDRYHTGFPCGRYYALASTWLDTTATRAGTVLTHTLLVPSQEARALEELWTLAAHHQRPRGAADWDLYTRALEVDLAPLPTGSSVSPAEKEGMVTLAFGQSQRPILWVDPSRPEAAVRYLWSLLWPEQRESFAFCTLALQLRAVEGRRFDFLGLPPESRGSFLQFAGSEAWWDHGKPVHTRVQGLSQQPWAQDILRSGPAATHRLVDWCRTQGLSLPQPWELPVLWRFLDLEPAATERLAAARSRADLFERLWPELDPLNPCALRVLEDLLALQKDAALKPKPFWELVDLLGRGLLRRRCKADPAFAARVEDIRATELTERLRQEPELATAQLLDLINASDVVPWSHRSASAIQQTVKRSVEPVPLSIQLLLASAHHGWQDIAEAALEPLSESDKSQVLDGAMQSAAGKPQLLPFVSQIAEQLRDPGFILAVALRRGEPTAGLRKALRLLLERNPAPSRELVDALLHMVDQSARLEWALDERDERLVAIAADLIGHELHEAKLSPAEVVKFCEGSPNGPRVVTAWFTALGRSAETVRLLRDSPTLARDMVLMMLRDERLPQDRTLFRQAMEAMRPEQFMTSEIQQTLRAPHDRSQARELLSRYGTYWVRDVADMASPPAVLAEWLNLPLLRDWLADSSPGQLFYAVGPSSPGRHLPHMAAVIHAWLRQGDSKDVSWVGKLLRHLMEDAPSFYLEDSAQDLIPILRQVLPRYDGQYLAMQLLNSLSLAPTAQGWRFVELAFPLIYPRIEKNAPSWLEQGLRKFASWVVGGKDKDWDHARPMRWWLIDTYISRSWPPESLLRCLSGDKQLFRRLAYRAAKSTHGLEFLKALPRALSTDPELERWWRRPIEEILANPPREVDYE